LNKAFYFALLFLYKSSYEVLPDCTIIRGKKGPEIKDFNKIIKELEDKEWIDISATPLILKDNWDDLFGLFREDSYRLLIDNYEIFINKLTDEEISAIKESVNFVRDKTSQELTSIINEYSNSLDREVGQTINIYMLI
jgi:hypothetical protein